MDGLVVINKPTGITSRDVVNQVSKVFKTKKVGHTGTLDPLATGVLVVCINKGTKLVEVLTDHEKDYVATVKLGLLTDTLDVTGNILKEEQVCVDKDKLINTLNSFNKTYLQEVPIYSAVKINGKKLYEYARNGEKVELPKRKVTISNIELLDYSETSFKFKVHVSKGTYIRALINDICHELGVLGVMSELTRTSLGDYSLEEAVNLDELSLTSKCYSIDEILSKYHTIDLDEQTYFDIKNGKKYDADLKDELIYFRYLGNPVALYKKLDDNAYHMFKYFN